MPKRPYQLRWGREAATELEAAVDYLMGRSVEGARSLLQTLEQQLARVQHMPRSGRSVPELARDDFREVFVQAYRIIHRIRDSRSEIQILAVIHAARLLPEEVSEREP